MLITKWAFRGRSITQEQKEDIEHIRDKLRMYCITDYWSKIKLLFLLLFSINNFKPAISKDYQFASIAIAQDAPFVFLEMLVNLNQYRVAIGVFNNRSFITTKKLFCARATYKVRKMSLLF